jgi:ABC-2 type transport system ATP-binding protein
VPGVSSVESTPAGLRVLARAEDGIVPRVVSASAGFGLLDVTTAEASLETVFIRLTGRDLRE